MRLAEDLSVVDNLSGGRIEIGLGQGYRPAEFDQFGWNYKTRTRAFEESLDILEKAWSGETFDYAGKIYSVKGGRLSPPPVTPGRPPLWIGAAHPKARARAVRRGAGFLVAPLAEWGLVEYQFESLDEEAARQGAGRLPRAVMREILVGDSPADAMKRHQPFIDEVYRVQYKPERIGLTYVDPATKERKPLTSDNPYFMSEEFMQDRWLLGTPEEIAAKIAKWQPRLGMDHLIFTPRPPGMPLKQAVGELELISKIAPEPDR
jgi:alkanesulfonate monooxygenase SsuD/methylene tetrahydromethanopterin reductase-like flavin-dependent oxidoreductase (luciferase family)